MIKSKKKNLSKVFVKSFDNKKTILKYGIYCV